VDLLKDEVVAGFDGGAEAVVEQADAASGGREQEDEPDVALTERGGVGEGDEEQRGGGACEKADQGGDGNPAGEIEEEWGDFLLADGDWISGKGSPMSL